MARPQLEIVHVGSACRDIDPTTRAAGGSAAA